MIIVSVSRKLGNYCTDKLLHEFGVEIIFVNLELCVFEIIFVNLELCI